jgi:LacI family transcriptional regulator
MRVRVQVSFFFRHPPLTCKTFCAKIARAMRPTIREVAREAGVSIATVSHALSGKRPVSGATRKRIRSAARKLGYRPNQLAASMITGRTQTLGVLVPDIANPFFSGLVHAAEAAAAARGYTVVFSTAELEPALEARAVEVLHDKRVDALLYLGGTDRENKALRALARAGTPVVALDEALPTIPRTASLVTVDNEEGGRLAAHHLLELGHTELAAVTGPSGLPTSRARLKGLADGAGERKPHRRRIRYAEAYTIEGGRAAAHDLLEREPEITALFCANDLMALGALEAARGLGRRVPEDLSILGFDDIFVSALVSPPLTTIRQPLARLGKEAAELAIDLIDGNVTGPERRVLPIELVVRESTTRPAARRGALAAANA